MGIYSYCCSQANILANSISGASSEGIYCLDSGVTVENNLVTGGSIGMYLRGSNGPVANNTLTANATGLRTTVSSNTISNNVIAFNSSYGVRCNRIMSGQTLSHNDVYGNPHNYQGPSPGATDISADPLFVDSAGSDYHLQTGSPCIDAGDDTAVDSSGLERDLDGNPRIMGAHVDIGAYEFPVVTLVRDALCYGALTVLSVGGSQGLVVTAGTDVFTNCFYMQDPGTPGTAYAIRVKYSGSSPVLGGDMVTVQGSLNIDTNGEAYLQAGSAGVTWVSHASPLPAIWMPTTEAYLGGNGLSGGTYPGVTVPAACGPYNKGRLVKCVGTVEAVYPTEECFYIYDGSQVNELPLDDGTSHGHGVRVGWDWQSSSAVPIVPPAQGWYVAVTGISSSDERSDGQIFRVLRPRSQGDITVYQGKRTKIPHQPIACSCRLKPGLQNHEVGLRRLGSQSPTGDFVLGVAANSFDGDFNAFALTVYSPCISNLSAPSGPTSLYDKFELQFDITGVVPGTPTAAGNVDTSGNLLVNPYWPYDPSPACNTAEQPNAVPAGVGISVDGLFLPPSDPNTPGTAWGGNDANAIVQPAFYFQDYQRGNCLIQNGCGPDWLYPSGTPCWKLRFAPSIAGPWQYKIRITDSRGTLTYMPASNTFTCTGPAVSPGFVEVSPTDNRYFCASDGTYPNFCGTENPGYMVNGVNVGAGTTYAQDVAYPFFSQNGWNLLRVWWNATNDLAVFGIYSNGHGCHGWADGTGQGLNVVLGYGANAKPGQLFCVDIAGSNDISTSVDVTPGTRYLVSADVKTVGLGSGQAYIIANNVVGYQPNTVNPLGGLPLTGDNDWTHLRLPVVTLTGVRNIPNVNVEVVGAPSTSHVYATNFSVREQDIYDGPLGPELVWLPNFDAEMNYSQVPNVESRLHGGERQAERHISKSHFGGEVGRGV